MTQSIGPALRRRWRVLSGLPGGKAVFSRVLGLFVPYTGRLGARVEELDYGLCAVTLRERRAVRNHLHSVHAMALANLGEMVTGLALINSLPDNARGILVGFGMDYLKKARGTLRAECHCPVPEDNGEREYTVEADILDSAGETVAHARAVWRIGPEPAA